MASRGNRPFSRSCSQFPQFTHRQSRQQISNVVHGERPLEKTAAAFSTSSSVDSRPREKRTSEFARSVDRWRRSHAKAQANPPNRQNRWRRRFLPNPGRPAAQCCPRHDTTKAAVFASRLSREPTNSTPSVLPDLLNQPQGQGFKEAAAKTGGRTKRSSASTRPTIPARFSVPARRSFSCPPPNRIGSGNRGDLAKSSPAPFGP